MILVEIVVVFVLCSHDPRKFEISRKSRHWFFLHCFGVGCGCDLRNLVGPAFIAT